MPANRFSVGQQPCAAYRPAIEVNEFAAWENAHECIRCGGIVSYCTACCHDHHAGGWETCREGEEVPADA
jgi:hypothetical protein